MSEEAKHSVYDFGFITQALGLIPINADSAAINPGAIVDFQQQPDNTWVLALHGDRKYFLEAEDMAELEQTIKQRAEIAKAIQKEAIKNQMMAQAEAAVEVQNKLNSGVQPGMIVGAPTGKRFRQ